MNRFLGVDIGGTNVKIGIVDDKGELLEKYKHPTVDVSKDGKFVENFTSLLKDILEKNTDIKKVGIGIPGIISKDRLSTLELPNIPSLSNQRIIPYLTQHLPEHEFFLENDANAAAIGEFLFGDHDIKDHLILLTLGTGLGGGVILDRKIFKGGDGNGMEIGHIISSSGETIEYHVGKKGIVRTAHELLKKYDTDSFLDKYKGDFTAKEVVSGAKKGDKVCKKVFKKVGKYTGECIVAACRIFDIKTIVIGGGVSDTYPYISKSMNKAIHANLTEYYLKDLKIEIATLKNEAGIIGAASLCLQ